MKTFTVRDLSRSPKAVLDATRLDGRARIRDRGGRTYIIVPETVASQQITALPDFKKRRLLFRRKLPASTVRQLDFAIANDKSARSRNEKSITVASP